MNFHKVFAPYCQLMNDIKQRAEAIELLETSSLPQFCIADAQRLQMRMICETLALACLTAHGDLAGVQSKRLTKAYEADKIMNVLESLHPDFYPKPLQPKESKNDARTSFVYLDGGYLTKGDLLATYRSAGDFLHVGNIEGLTKGTRKMRSQEPVTIWLNKLKALLSIHTIHFADRPDSWHGRKRLMLDSGAPAPRFQMLVAMAPAVPGAYPMAKLFESIRRVEDVSEG